ncbi:hypothetical protein B4096_3372 [Heyndrickxia coagulans]|nr:hypothetical protein B4096_3372 [Heyndrickxia coagulans]
MFGIPIVCWLHYGFSFSILLKSKNNMGLNKIYHTSKGNEDCKILFFRIAVAARCMNSFPRADPA